MNQPQRMFVDPETGERYRAWLTPRERTGRIGVDKRVNALVFETPKGEWVGSVPVYHYLTLQSLTEDDLGELLDQAVARG